MVSSSILLVGTLTSELLLMGTLLSKPLLMNSLASRLLLSPLTGLLLLGSLTSDLPVHAPARPTRMGAQSTLLREGVLMTAVVLLLGEGLGVLLLGGKGVGTREQDEGLGGAGLGVGLLLVGELTAQLGQVIGEGLDLRLGVLDVGAGGHDA